MVVEVAQAHLLDDFFYSHGGGGLESRASMSQVRQTCGRPRFLLPMVRH